MPEKWLMGYYWVKIRVMGVVIGKYLLIGLCINCFESLKPFIC
jgi:hypothetical protein